MSAPLLYLEDVYKAYGSKTVLDDIDFKVTAGEFLSVVGPSGCGKSTLLRLVLGAEWASSGRVLIDGEPVGHADPRRGIVYQRYSLFPHLSVLENVVLGRRLEAGLFGWSGVRAGHEEEARAILKTMRLDKDCGKFPHELSGGMQQRVAIAQALIMKPKILLMDEPFGALDPGTREDMQLHLLETWEKHTMTIFFVTHDLEEAVFLGTRVVVLSQFYKDGRGERAPGRGARIVADYQVKKAGGSTALKKTAEFGELVASIRREGFEPDYLQHAKDFNLKHPDSWRTLKPDEARDA